MKKSGQSKPGKKAPARAKIDETLPVEVANALFDNRENDSLSSLGGTTAIAAVKERARRDAEGHPHGNSLRFTSFQEQLERAALEGDSQFFRDFAEGLDFIKERKMTVSAEGELIEPMTPENFSDAERARIYMQENWPRWETEATPVKNRIAETQEKGGRIDRSKFYAFAKRLKSLISMQR